VNRRRLRQTLVAVRHFRAAVIDNQRARRVFRSVAVAPVHMVEHVIIVALLHPGRHHLHGFADRAAFIGHLKKLASQHHGVIAREFVRRLIEWLHRDPDELKAWLDKRRKAYLKHCRSITDPKRDLLRVHHKFGTIYAAGRLGIHFKLLPFSRRELLDAILSCERDHVALVASFASAAQPPVAKLYDYIAGNKSRFADVRQGPKPAGFNHASCPGYRSRGEFWLTSPQFEQVVGGKVAAQRAKAELDQLNLIRKVAGGKDGRRFVVKRPIGTKRNGKAERRYVVAIDAGILKKMPIQPKTMRNCSMKIRLPPPRKSSGSQSSRNY